MDLYGLVVFVHATAILLFFIAHGASMAVALRLKQESDPARIRALLDVSSYSLGRMAGAAAIIGLLAGIVAGFMGGWWDELWIWISLVLILVVGIGMTPMVAFRLNAMRAAAGLPNPSKKSEPAPPENPEELQRLLAAWQPMPIAIIGLVAFVAVLYLMLFKPF